MTRAIKNTVILFALGLLLLVATDAVESEDKRAQCAFVFCFQIFSDLMLRETKEVDLCADTVI